MRKHPNEAAGGLSPRVRGNLAQMQRNLSTYRSIPACAGEPAAAARRRW